MQVLQNTSSRLRAAISGLAVAALAGGVLIFGSAQAAPEVTVADVENAFHQVEVISEQINQVDVEIKKTKSDIKDLSEDIARQKRIYNRQRKDLSAAIVQQQLDSPLGPTISLLGSGDPVEFLNGLGAVQALNSTRTEALEQFSLAAKQLKNRRAQLRDREKQLLADQAEAEKKKAAMRKKYEEAKADLERLTAAEQQAFNASNLNLDFEVPAKGRAKTAIDFALAQLGDPYVWGGTGPDSWDCSGLMMKSWEAAGVSLPRVVGPQFAATREIPLSELQPGDLVFYGDMSHDGMYLGQGKVIHAPRPGKRVEITTMSGYSKAGRVG